MTPLKDMSESFQERHFISATAPVCVCLFLFIALSPIQDSLLQGTWLSTMGRSFSLFPLALLFLISAGNWLLKGRFFVSKPLLLVIGYVLALTLYGLAEFGWHSHGQNMLLKSISSSVPLILLLFVIFKVPYHYRGVVKSALLVAFALLVIGFLLGSLNVLGLKDLVENPFFHFVRNTGERPRSFATESSEFSIQILGLGLLSMHYARSKTLRISIGAIATILLIVGGSRGGILTFLLCLVILVLIRKHRRWYQVAGAILLALPVAFFTSFLIPQLFPESSLTEYTSVATRGGMITCALVIVAHHPLGVGLSGFLPAIASYLPASMEYLQRLFRVPLNFKELAGYITSAENIGTKTFFFDQLIRFGLPFALLFLIWSFRVIRKLAQSDQRYLCIAAAAAVIGSITYIQPVAPDICPIVMGVALCELRQRKDSGRFQRLPLSPQPWRPGGRLAAAASTTSNENRG